MPAVLFVVANARSPSRSCVLVSAALNVGAGGTPVSPAPPISIAAGPADTIATSSPVPIALELNAITAVALVRTLPTQASSLVFGVALFFQYHPVPEFQNSQLCCDAGAAGRIGATDGRYICQIGRAHV